MARNYQFALVKAHGAITRQNILGPLSAGGGGGVKDCTPTAYPYSGWPVPADISKLATPSAWNCTVERHRTPLQIHLASASSICGSNSLWQQRNTTYARTHYGERPEVLAHRLQHRLGMRSVKKRRSTLAWPSAALFTSPRFFSSDNVLLTHPT